MNGVRLEFYTGRNKRHENQPLWEWVVRSACAQGIRGATVMMASLGFGHHRRIEPPYFFQLADQPVVITMILSDEESDQFIASLKRDGIKDLFYVKEAVEFETL
ncbi:MULTISPECIES: DUF190 domain-containing protein [Ramlibacter]|uniref:DUF190 domain-containing protein n=1 Tax=Ramlibacter pinisoli TaxID=2682844 RepID=A0A6N8IR98_9BURK|nr:MULTISPECIES: DUF190 domain-containing protein [Ramlibacter]MBA2963804.1 DUF190 domain-containing protein [Ramlibacter sp. CGMCC 1.13660]MVQ28770.1 DUF190 domain-containing protein [Ramlibacter pinisoli]